VSREHGAKSSMNSPENAKKNYWKITNMLERKNPGKEYIFKKLTEYSKLILFKLGGWS